jgi:GNAT superfamily N-acetyltransferase
MFGYLVTWLLTRYCCEMKENNDANPDVLVKNISIRGFRKEDLNQLKDLIDKTIDANYGYYPIEFVTYWKENLHSKKSILKDSAGGFIAIAESSGKIVGTGTVIGDEISRVFVDPQYQRKGIGKLVMDKLEKQAIAEGVSIVHLTSTASSKLFYDSLGYLSLQGKIFSAENSQEIGYYQMSKQL